MISTFRLPFQKSAALLHPVLLLHEHIRQLFICIPVCLDPDIQQSFGHEAEDARVVAVIAADVEASFELEEDVEQPRAIGMDFFTAHDEHVEAVTDSAFHRGVENVHIVWITLP